MEKEIQEATASEPLTLEDEYAMQESWRLDGDKLTFIVCLPVPAGTLHLDDDVDKPEKMLGDVNLFLKVEDDEEVNEDHDKNSTYGSRKAKERVVGEIELMIAEKHNQTKGYGRAALVSFLQYIADHQAHIVDEFSSQQGIRSRGTKVVQANDERKLGYLSVKIGQSNPRSLALFESVGFKKVSAEPNYFGEFELRRTNLNSESVSVLLSQAGIEWFRELVYNRE